MSRFALKNTKKSALALIGVAALSLTMAAPALADPVGDSTNVTISGGALSMSSTIDVGDFTGVTLDGTNKTTTALLNSFWVNDQTGSGSGWHVNVEASQFKEYDVVEGDFVEDGKTLPAGSLNMETVSVAQDG